jgi:hypothetical protein
MSAEALTHMRRVWEDLVALGPRMPATAAMDRTTEILVAALGDDGAAVRRHRFSVRDWRPGPSRIEIGGTRLECMPMIQSPGTAGVRGRLAHGGVQDIWGMHAWRRYLVVADDDGIGAMILARRDGEAIPEPMLPGALGLPHVVVGRDDIDALDAAVESRAEVCVTSEAVLGPDVELANLVLEQPGEAGARLLLCAHVDSVYTTAGAYDNASGAALLTALARSLPRNRADVAIDCVWFNAEEWAMQGSAALAHERADDWDLVINLDGIGRGPTLELWAGPEWFAAWMLGLIGHRCELHFPPPDGSDHAAFERRGLPVAMFTHNDQEIIHTARDDRLTAETWENMVRLLDLLDELLPRIADGFVAARAAYLASDDQEIGTARPGSAAQRSSVFAAGTASPPAPSSIVLGDRGSGGR